MPPYISWPIVRAVIRESEDPYMADVVLAIQILESGGNPVAVGVTKKEKTPISFGMFQPTLVVAREALHRKVTKTELLADPVVNAIIAVKHLKNTKHYQGWSAGETGAKAGGGSKRAAWVMRRLAKASWSRKNRSGKLDWRYGKYFDFSMSHKENLRWRNSLRTSSKKK